MTQDQAPQSVLVYPSKGGSVDVDVTVARNTWFLQSLVALVVGLIVVAFAGGWLWQHWRTVPESVEPAPDAGATADRSPAASSDTPDQAVEPAMSVAEPHTPETTETPTTTDSTERPEEAR